MLFTEMIGVHLQELHNTHKDKMRQKAECCSFAEGGTCTGNWASAFKYLHLCSMGFLYTLWTVEIDQVEVYIGYGGYCGIKLCIDNLHLNETFCCFPKIREKTIKFFIQLNKLNQLDVTLWKFFLLLNMFRMLLHSSSGADDCM